MKRCPECRRDYYDDTLVYCLDDGNTLLDGPRGKDQPTAIFPVRAAGESERPTRIFSVGRRKRSIWLAALAVLFIGIVAYWISLRSVAPNVAPKNTPNSAAYDNYLRAKVI